MKLKSIAEKIIAESSFSRVWNHVNNSNTFAVISAFRGFNTPVENLKLNTNLKADVRKLGLGFVEQEGGYTYIEPSTGEETPASEERSLFIPEITFDQAIDLAKKYGQESMIFKDADKFVLYNPKTDKVVLDFAKDRPLTFSPEAVKMAYSKFLRSKNTGAQGKYSFVVKELVVPTREEAYGAIKNGTGFANARWMKIIEGTSEDS